jgi:thiamine-monophosphate kinase
MRLNECGFSLAERWRKALSELAITTAGAMHIPEWLFLAGEHGEFELIFTVPRETEPEFLVRAQSASWSPIALGEVIEIQQVRIALYKKELPLDTGEIRNLGASGSRNIEQYLKSLLAIDKRLGKERTTV